MDSTALCQTCEKVFQRLASNSHFGDVISTKTIDDTAATSACSFCRLLVRGLLDGLSHLPIDKVWQVEVELPYRPAGIHGRLSARLRNKEKIVTSCELGSVGHPDSDFRLVVGHQIDPELAVRWMAICSERHDTCNLRKTTLRAWSGNDFALRCVDVQNSCLVNFPATSGPRYATLSYVWGDVPSFRLSRQMLPVLQERGSLDRIDLIPRTIQDSIIWTRNIGIKYLWVDSLCLVQDDEKEMEQGIKAMDLIYSHSTLNIIAASGFDAGSGLPGVRFGSRLPAQIQETVHGYTFISYRSVSSFLERSRYTTRGWTYVTMYRAAYEGI